MIDRRALIAAATFGLLALTVPARAEGETPYTAEAFEAAKAAGSPILIEIAADWCPTCRAQKPIIAALKAKPAFKDLVVLRVDFDAQKDVVRAFGARMQSTLIALRGGTEVGRSVGETDPAAIEAMVLDALRG